VTSIETAPSRALGINASGQIVGQNNEGKAVLYQGDGPDRSLTDVPSEARAINDGGTVVGWHEVDGHPQAFVYDRAGIRNLFAPISDESEASAINSAGDVAGSITDYKRNGAGIGGAERTAFQLRAGSTTPELLTGAPGKPILVGYDDSFANGINGSRWVVGGATGNGQDKATAWLWVEGQLFDLSEQLVTAGGSSPFVTGNAEGWVNLLNAYGVSDSGQIVGQGTWQFMEGATWKQEPRAFYLRLDPGSIPPIPEPGIYLMLVCGLFAIAVVRLRRLSAR
jgi:probable HAF family extracellular repeat protein